MLIKKLLTLFFLVTTLVVNAQWSTINGPFGNQGNNQIRNVAIDGSTIFAVTTSLGVYYSTDDGLHWITFNNGLNLSQSYFNSIHINGDDIFLTSNKGVYKTTLSSGLWVLSNSGFPPLNNFYGVNHLEFNGTQIYAATGNGLYSSLDNGLTWGLLNNTQYATFVLFDNGKLYFTHSTGIKLSLDNGITWNSLGGQIIGCTSMLINNEKLFVGTTDSSYTTAKIYSSIDGGQNWTISDDNVYNRVNSLVKNGSKIYMTAFVGIKESSDNGITWSQVLHPNLINTDCFAASSGNKIVIGCKVGNYMNGNIFLSNDYGVSWNSINKNLTGCSVKSIAFLESKIHVWLNDYGSIRTSSYDGSDWKDSGGSNKNPISSGTRLFSTGGSFGGSIYTSTDGYNWSLVNSTSMDSEIVSLKLNGNILYACTYYNVFKSTDNGVNWTVFSTFDYVNDIIFDGNITYLVRNSTIFKSSDDGITWLNITPSNLTSIISTSAIKGGDIYLGTAGVNSNGAPISQGIFKSSNGGTSWSFANNGLVPFITEDISVSGSDIYAITKNYNNSLAYVFVSNNNGTNWQMFSDNNLNAAIPQKLAFNGNYIYCGTLNNGLWRKQISTLSSNNPDINSNSNEIIIYPNPFNEEIKISLAENENACIKIFNFLGQELKSIDVNQQENTLLLSDLNSGVYIMNFYNNEKKLIESKKIIKN